MSSSNSLKVVVVDDTILYRKIVSDVLAEIPNVEVVGTANNGKIALSKIASLKPDVVTLDIEMPVMSGLEVLAHIQKEFPEVHALVLSTLTQQGSEMTIRALELGAFDFIPKPQSGTMNENKQAVKDALVPMLKAIVRRREIKTILKSKQPPKKDTPLTKDQIIQLTKTGTISKATHTSSPPEDITARMQKLSKQPHTKSEIVAIGISTGGPNALAKMMPMIPGDIGVPILIVQHMPPVFTQSLAKSLSTKCKVLVKEAVDGEILAPNVAFIAPGGKQMKIVASSDGKNRIIRITDDPPENSCKPSADYLFRSVANYYVGRATGVIMTGMGSDGLNGLKLMNRNGAFIIAQDEATCTVFGMPKEPIEAGIVNVVSPLDQIAIEIIKTVKKFY
ncbi:MAG: chemotaxis response regulator protein-glutamate methylesterase [Desulfobacterales bacterium]|nr:chemotaxis response regulator protein-glutamate methylesterase [Desulfobacterales bacterium]MBF0395889.1 chemotaxis response regulator protein-glutamate methylesterase [Desulfobacterales bacterium]